LLAMLSSGWMRRTEQHRGCIYRAAASLKSLEGGVY
jgi:hypothetical protein